MMSILVLGKCIISFACQNVLNKRSTNICKTKRSWTPYVFHCTTKTNLECLATCADSHAASAEGPVLVGTMTELVHGKTCKRLAQHYWSAFTHNTHVYPYYGEQP